MGIEEFTVELKIGWFGSRSSVAKIYEKESANLPVRKHLTEIAGSTEFNFLKLLIIALLMSLKTQCLATRNFKLESATFLEKNHYNAFNIDLQYFLKTNI
ncbi:hypothetical protein [Borreliella valaisiana]|uniref:hypothetical protein n=1 Tax=Borreliella valaisiana TaxID=62088 RepID=UPI002ED13151|nr:hypothetical protein KJD09_04600 [Borreliella valaisiana]